jgi:DNA end-binding protein Ku
VNFSDDKTSAATINAMHAVDIIAFVAAQDIPFSCFETPYYLAPAPGGEKVYALLRETLNRTNKVGIAHVVIQARRHIAALIPCGPVLVLNTLRLSGDERIPGRRTVPSEEHGAVTLSETELASAAKVVESMTQTWDIKHYHTTFRAQLDALEPRGDAADAAKFMFDAPVEQADADVVYDDDTFDLLRRGGCASNRAYAQRNRAACRVLESGRPKSKSRRTLH